MTPSFQTVQVILFVLPILVLFAIGLKILISPVGIIDQRWFLAVLYPLLVANSLVIAENIIGLQVNITGDWRLVLIVIADLAFFVGFALYFRGILIYGLGPEAIESALESIFAGQGYEIHISRGEKSFLWERVKDACILSVEKAGQREVLWFTTRFNEVLLRADTPAGLGLLRSALPELKKEEELYDLKTHATGILYIVLAIIFAVLTWIFFFEPRFILIS